MALLRRTFSRKELEKMTTSILLNVTIEVPLQMTCVAVPFALGSCVRLAKIYNQT